MKFFVRGFATKLIRPENKGFYAAILRIPMFSSQKEQNIGDSNLLLKKENGHLKNVPSFVVASDDELILRSDIEREIRRTYSIRDVEPSTHLGHDFKKSEELKDFLQLLNPSVLKHLKLELPANRDLINFYNFCLFKDNKSDDLNEERVTRNRCFAVVAGPSIMKEILKKENQFQGFLNKLDQGLSPDLLKEIFGQEDWATVGFVRRFSKANIDSFAPIEQLGKILAFNPEGEKFDQDKFGKKVSRIPFSSLQKKEFDNLLDVLEYFKEQDFPLAVQSNLLQNVTSWSKSYSLSNQKSSAALRSNYYGPKKYFEDLAALVLSRCLTDFVKEYKTADPSLADKIIKPEFIEKLLEIAVPETQKAVSAFLNPLTLEGYTKRARDNIGVIGRAKSNDRNLEWYPVIEEQEYKGCKIKALTTQEELDKESRTMANCLDGFTNECLRGSAVILAGKGPRGLFNLLIGSADKKFVLSQAKGPGNIDFDDKTIFKSLVDDMNKKVIKTSPKLGSVRDLLTLSERLGFNPLDEAQQNSLLQAFRETKTLPNALRNCANTEELVNALKIDKEFVQKKLYNLFIPSPITSVECKAQLDNKSRQL